MVPTSLSTVSVSVVTPISRSLVAVNCNDDCLVTYNNATDDDDDNDNDNDYEEGHEIDDWGICVDEHQDVEQNQCTILGKLWHTESEGKKKQNTCLQYSNICSEI